MSKKLEQAAVVAGFLAMVALAAPVRAQLSNNDDREMPAAEAPTADQVADYCSEQSRWFRRDLSNTDGDTNPPLQTEQECRQQFGDVERKD